MFPAKIVFIEVDFVSNIVKQMTPVMSFINILIKLVYLPNSEITRWNVFI